MKTFRLIGNTTRFILERTFKSANCIPAVVGITPDGTKRTIAAEADIIWLDDFRYKPVMVPDELGRFAVHDGDAEDIIDRALSAKGAETMAILLNIREELKRVAI